jgi:hypothetical protein
VVQRAAAVDLVRAALQEARHTIFLARFEIDLTEFLADDSRER